jgi:hypothetical protein
MSGRSLLLIATLALSGCLAQRRVNPSFALSETQAREALREMRQAPVSPQRPILILGGFADIGIGAGLLRHKLDPLFSREQTLVITFADCASFEQCREKVIRRVQEEFPSDDPRLTSPVDVVGQSMGGLIAVFSAADFGDGARRLNAANIFTLSSPLDGAKLADRWPIVLTAMHRDMQHGSRMYDRLDQAEISANLFSYTRLYDQTVGDEYASLPGHGVWWVDVPPFQTPHLAGVMDDRIIADVARRLRGETPFATSPPAPLPQ